MRVAVLEMDGYVSPRLERCTRLRFAEIDAGRILCEQSRDVSNMPPAMLDHVLNALDLDVLVCGGIPPAIGGALCGVIPGVIGTTDQVLQALAQGKLRSGAA